MDPVSIFFIGLLLSIIGYLIVEGRLSQKETNKRLFDLIEKNTSAISDLNTTIQLISSESRNFHDTFEEHKKICGYPNAKKN